MEVPDQRDSNGRNAGTRRKMGLWDLTELPKGKRLVDSKLDFNMKFKAYGTIECYKAPLVAKEYTKTYGIHYTKTLAPVTKLHTNRVLVFSNQFRLAYPTIGY